ncbi:transducin beta-like protein 3 [Orussus abietinus]|uniref:transducin beta-like protein 3 n=1 Tax=Orussus abietinus TaxID=222816 RepID=UPI0006254991|nr:transducin beta-like protein 3 [Orussus abietinus]
MNKKHQKTSFEVESKYGPFYTGGTILWTADGEHLLCQNGTSVSVVSVETATTITTLGEMESEHDQDAINTFAFIDNDQRLLTHHKSGLFKLWNWKEKSVDSMWKSVHIGPVACIKARDDGVILASGGSDSSVRLWNLQNRTCTHNLKGIQGVTSILVFHPDDKNLLFGAGDNLGIHCWNIESGQCKAVLKGHCSRVTSLCFYKDKVQLISSGRDKVLILWNLVQGTILRTIAVYESIEGAFILPDNRELPYAVKPDGIYVATAGATGLIRVWEVKAGSEVYSQKVSLLRAADEDGLSATHLLYNDTKNSIAVVSVDHNIIIHSLEDFECKKQLVGYSDEILDVVYVGDQDSHLAVATNSADVKLYELSTMDCQLLRGHTDIVLALATSAANRNLLLSSSKDNSVRLWMMNKDSKKVSCIRSGVRHTAPVGSVAFSQTSATSFASIGQDCCLKLWELPRNLDVTGGEHSLNATHTALAHEKDINSVAISPNDKLIATGSQDKTAKLWTATDLQLLGVFRGHRRGVWCVRFSPVAQVLLTSSADCSIKLWCLSELNCLKTLEGHESSVLRAEFVTRGTQLISSGGDGLLKLWDIKTSECVATLEQHDNRVWTLAVSRDERHIISGGSDSVLVIWRDVTEEKLAKALEEKERLALEEQKLANLLQANRFAEALRVALGLERPLQTLRIIDDIIKRGNKELLVKAIQDLTKELKEALLRCAISWNTNSRNCHAAQLVMHELVNEISTEKLQIPGLSKTIEEMIPYTERHFKRLDQLCQDLHLFKYTISRMKVVTNDNPDAILER